MATVAAVIDDGAAADAEKTCSLPLLQLLLLLTGLASWCYVAVQMGGGGGCGGNGGGRGISRGIISLFGSLDQRGNCERRARRGEKLQWVRQPVSLSLGLIGTNA